MQDSITKALLFVIALSTSIIAVELIPQHQLNRQKLTCLNFYANLSEEEGLLELFKELDDKDLGEDIYCKYLLIE